MIESAEAEADMKATAERIGGLWCVTIIGLENPPAIQTRTLADAQNKACRAVHGFTCRRIGVDLEVVLPSATRTRLELVAALHEDAAKEIDEIRRELAEAGLSPIDVDWLVRKVWP